ncbi:MAG: O-antigen ligase family protein, partial [Chloroflexota bacterium]
MNRADATRSGPLGEGDRPRPTARRWDGLVLPPLLLATTLASTVWWQLPWLPGQLIDQGPGNVPVAVADLLLLLLVLTSALAWLRRRRGPSLCPLGLTIPVLLVVVLAAAGVPWAPDPRLAADVTVHLALLTLLCLVCASGIVRPMLLAAALVSGLVVQVPLAIEQAVRQTTAPLGLVLAWPGNYTPTMAYASVLLRVDGSRWLRAYGPFAHPNILGGYLALELPLLIGLLLAVWPLFASRLPRVLLGLPVGLVFVGLALSASRSAWLGASAGLLALAVANQRNAWSRRRLWPVDRRDTAGAALLAVLTLAVALLLLRPPLLDRFDPGSNRLERQSVQERLFFDRAGLQLLASHPFLGVGAGNVDLAESIFFHRTIGPAPMHDVPLLMAVELGPLSALAWLLAAAYILAQSWRQPSWWTSTFAAALVAVGAASLFDHYFWDFPVAGTTMAVLAGAWAAALREEGADACCNPPGTSLRRMRGGTD